MKLMLVRHPPVDLADGTCYGRLDAPLTAGWRTWAKDVAVLADKLGRQVVCYSSPASRCRVPAQALGLQVVEDPRLMEMNFGHVPDYEIVPFGILGPEDDQSESLDFAPDAQSPLTPSNTNNAQMSCELVV